MNKSSEAQHSCFMCICFISYIWSGFSFINYGIVLMAARGRAYSVLYKFLPKQSSSNVCNTSFTIFITCTWKHVVKKGKLSKQTISLCTLIANKHFINNMITNTAVLMFVVRWQYPKERKVISCTSVSCSTFLLVVTRCVAKNSLKNCFTKSWWETKIFAKQNKNPQNKEN